MPLMLSNQREKLLFWSEPRGNPPNLLAIRFEIRPFIFPSYFNLWRRRTYRIWNMAATNACPWTVLAGAVVQLASLPSSRRCFQCFQIGTEKMKKLYRILKGAAGEVFLLYFHFENLMISIHCP